MNGIVRRSETITAILLTTVTLIFLVGFSTFPGSVRAQLEEYTDVPNDSSDSTVFDPAIGDPVFDPAIGDPVGGAGILKNPLKFNSITQFLFAIIEVLLIFAVPIVVFFIIYAGFLFVTAQGDTTKIETARSALTWAVIGGVIVLGAEIIVNVIQNTVDSFQP